MHLHDACMYTVYLGPILYDHVGHTHIILHILCTHTIIRPHLFPNAHIDVHSFLVLSSIMLYDCVFHCPFPLFLSSIPPPSFLIHSPPPSLSCQHDTTVTCLLSALGVFDMRYPEYASSVIVELYKKLKK